MDLRKPIASLEAAQAEQLFVFPSGVQLSCNYFSFRPEALVIRILMSTERWGLFFYFPPIPLSGIRYQEKEPNERELEELDMFFIFFGKKIRRTKRSKFNTNNITKTGIATAIYLQFKQ